MIFPRYYILGYVAGGLALIIAIYLLAAGRGPRLWWLASVIALGITRLHRLCGNRSVAARRCDSDRV